MTSALPTAVRNRVVAIAADLLPELTEIPPALRKVAEFTAARRARLGATPIATALERDDEFRRRIGVQAAAAQPELGEALGDGAVPSAADPVEVSALLWLTRPEGWEESLATLAQRIDEAPSARDTAAMERAQKRIAALEQSAREIKVEHQGELDALRAEHTTLRRRLGETRAAHREATARADRLAAELEDQRSAAATARSGTDAELRRLRARISELEAQTAASRREARGDREDATLRTRMLLDTLLEAGQGLRRELALPATDGTPAERVEAALADRAEGADATGSRAALSAAQVERFLGMPRARLIIDGYNVSKTAWPESALDAQRIRLQQALGPLVARVGAETTVVWDAAAATHRRGVPAPRGVRVLFSPEGVIADDVIRDLVAAEPPGRVVLVVSSDQALVRDVAAAGARPVAATTLLSMLT